MGAIYISLDFLKGEKKYVGITTRGDAKEAILRDLCRIHKTAMKHGIKISVYVCACHTGGKTINILQDLTKDGTLEIYGKTYYELYDRGSKQSGKSNRSPARDVGGYLKGSA